MRMLFETTMPVIMMTPISDMMLSVLPVSTQDQHHARESRRNGHEDDERIDERRELRHQDQVDQSNRDDETKAEIVEGLVHADHGAAHVDDRVPVVLGLRQQFVDLRAHLLQRFASWGPRKCR